ncbi:MAG: hypothetical protein JWO33_1047, partial [Caulobacteraceae bacterium]|nr:hypothetical protein [Caulobacteraceae bacterium]
TTTADSPITTASVIYSVSKAAVVGV